VNKLQKMAEDARRSSPGAPAPPGAACRPRAEPDPGDADAQGDLNKPIIKVPGCPPIAEVMTGVITYMLTFGMPELDRQGRRRCSTASASTTSATAARTSTPASSSRSSTTRRARKGYCLYKVGCKGPTTYNACSTTRWNERVSFPIESGHGCIGCSEDGLLGQGLVLRPRWTSSLRRRGQCRPVGGTLAAATGAAIAAHAAVSAIKRARDTKGEGHQEGSMPDHGRYATQRLPLDNSGRASSSTRSPASRATCASR
jgi:hydrogenase small subunit